MIVADAGSELSVRGLEIRANEAGAEQTIVAGLDLDLRAGETIAIVGESGSGKSMTALSIIDLLPPGVAATGQILFRGRDLAELPPRERARLRGDDLGLIMQDPFTMLNPLRRCGDQITETLVDQRGRRLGRRDRGKEARRRLAEVGIDDERVAEKFPFQLSGGMRQRVGIAASLVRDPSVLIADEPSTALDAGTQRGILSLLRSIQTSRGMALILITHDLRLAFAMSDRVYVLYAGSLLEVGTTAGIESEPLHPYTRMLLQSEPPADRRLVELPTVEGSVPRHDEVADRCAFAPRCRWSRAQCGAGVPRIREVEEGRLTACVRINEIREELAAVQAETASTDIAMIAGGEPPRTLIEVANATKLFGHGGGQVAALRDVSISVGEGESVGLVGESGSGKTTLGRSIVGLERLSHGTVSIEDRDATNFGGMSSQVRREIRGSVQIIFQDPYSSLNPRRTIGSILQEVLKRHASRGLEPTSVADLLTRVGLPLSYAGRKPKALSGGERQRVAIARALAARPRLIICDEPVSALDVSVQAQILNLFAQLRRDEGIGYLFITHDLAVVRQVVERIYVLCKGEIVEAGAVDEVLSNPRHPYTQHLVESVPRPDQSWLEDGAAKVVKG